VWYGCGGSRTRTSPVTQAMRADCPGQAGVESAIGWFRLTGHAGREENVADEPQRIYRWTKCAESRAYPCRSVVPSAPLGEQLPITQTTATIVGAVVTATSPGVYSCGWPKPVGTPEPIPSVGYRRRCRERPICTGTVESITARRVLAPFQAFPAPRTMPL
jgi:hypothetical protein